MEDCPDCPYKFSRTGELLSENEECRTCDRNTSDDDDDYIEDDDCSSVCECCGKDDNRCPMCCSNGGSYAPGSEECDFCPSSDMCHKDAIERYSNKKSRKHAG